MPARQRSTTYGVGLVLLVTLLTSVALDLVGVPSAVLFAGVIGGVAHALTSRSALVVPEWVFRIGQGMIGVAVGALVEPTALRRMAEDGASLGGVIVTTLLVSLVAGWILARRREVSLTTGVFALIAGGASGVVAVAHDLGADDRVVTVVQYLRVLVILVTMPLVASVVFRSPSGLGAVRATTSSWPIDLAFVGLSLVGGLVLAWLIPVTTMSLLAPMAIAAVLAGGGWLGDVSVPVWVQWVAFGLIGIQVGLRFTRASLASIARMLPVVLVIIVAMLAATAGLGVLLAAVTSVDPLTAYLATTPGGLPAVLAIAADSGSDVTYVMAAQLLRLLVILALLPALAAGLHRLDRDSGA